MKKFVLFVLLLVAISSLRAQDLKYIEASTLNLIGKPLPNTPNPYHRVDTLVFKGFNETENKQVRCPVGMAVLFRSNTSNISISTDWGYIYNSVSTMAIAYKGYDLYIKNSNGEYLIDGIINNSYQSINIDNHEFIKSIRNIRSYYGEYKTGYLEVNGKKVTFGNFLKEAYSKALPSGQKIERYKGLGEMSAEQLAETTLNPNTRILEKLTMNSYTTAIKTCNDLMGDDPEQRKDFLLGFKIDPDDIDT